MLGSVRFWIFCIAALLFPKADGAVILDHCLESEAPNENINFQFANLIDYSIFQKAIAGVKKFNPRKNILAICDFTKPSTEDRFFLFDLDQNKLLLSSLVAHGRNSGENVAKFFSNRMSSFQTSLGFYKIGSKIISPKHGEALLLEGLEKGKNDNARKREIIIHGADYVSYDFINQHGRLGRSQGCPALPNDMMDIVIPLIRDGALLYIHGK